MMNLENLNQLNLQNLGQKNAQSKQDDLWGKITADKTSGSFPGLSLAGIFVESMKTTFTA
jgi:hypothetical protein